MSRQHIQTIVYGPEDPIKSRYELPNHAFVQRFHFCTAPTMAKIVFSGNSPAAPFKGKP